MSDTASVPTFVQFIHPGPEHGADRPGHKGWNWDLHRRKFLRANGRYIEHLGETPREGELVFWGEWEAESDVEPIREPVRGGPRWLHSPYYVRPEAYRRGERVRQNTDPFVFGDQFFYTLCRQVRKSGRPTLLRDLDPGSLIVFGSLKAGEFVVDTVFVTGDSVLHELGSWEATLDGRVPETYVDVTLRPTYGWEDDRIRLRLYSGATIERPVDGMFSFVPALPGSVADGGFARPSVIDRELITPSLPMGFKATRGLSPSRIKSAWESIGEQIVAQDLALGTRFELPQRRAIAA